MKKKIVNQIFKVPNTPQGKLFIELVKEHLSPCYKIICKGRTLNKQRCKRKKVSKPLMRHMQGVGSYPLGLSDNIGVYITTKDGWRIGARNAFYYGGYNEKTTY